MAAGLLQTRHFVYSGVMPKKAAKKRVKRVVRTQKHNPMLWLVAGVVILAVGAKLLYINLVQPTGINEVRSGFVKDGLAQQTMPQSLITWNFKDNTIQGWKSTPAKSWGVGVKGGALTLSVGKSAAITNKSLQSKVRGNAAGTYSVKIHLSAERTYMTTVKYRTAPTAAPMTMNVTFYGPVGSNGKRTNVGQGSVTIDTTGSFKDYEVPVKMSGKTNVEVMRIAFADSAAVNLRSLTTVSIKTIEVVLTPIPRQVIIDDGGAGPKQTSLSGTIWAMQSVGPDGTYKEGPSSYSLTDANGSIYMLADLRDPSRQSMMFKSAGGSYRTFDSLEGSKTFEPYTGKTVILTGYFLKPVEFNGSTYPVFAVQRLMETATAATPIPETIVID